LLKAKQEDDEIVLQVIYVFHQLCSHKETKKFVLEETEAIPYLLDLLHDRNPEVQKVCDSTLQMIGEVSPDWSQRLLGEKFRFHNAQWIEMVQSQQLADLASMCQEEDEDGLLGEEDILDIDRAELLLGQDIGMDTLSDDEEEEEKDPGQVLIRSRPLSAYRRE